jgi:hypothetical protein
MSYCVNCGVELARSLSECPLCGVKVINPAQQETLEETSIFPETRDEFKKTDRTFWISFISVLVAVPIITCVLCDLLYSKRLTWSLYVIAGVLILWTVFVSPFFFKKFSWFKIISADMAGILAGLFIIELLSPGKAWLLGIALPVVLYSYIAWLLIIWLTKIKALRGLGISAACAAAIGALMMLLEILLDFNASGSVDLVWSLFIIAPCLSVATLLILLDRNKRFKEEMMRRLHI